MGCSEGAVTFLTLCDLLCDTRGRELISRCSPTDGMLTLDNGNSNGISRLQLSQLCSTISNYQLKPF